MNKVYFLVRHATADRPGDLSLYFNFPGPSLNKCGYIEAEAVAEFFLARPIGRLYASKMRRCAETAEIIQKKIGIKVEYIPELFEIALEEREGQTRKRVLELLRKLDMCQERPVMCVTHGGIISEFMVAVGWSKAATELQSIFDHGNPLPPGGVIKACQRSGAQGWEMTVAFLPKVKNWRRSIAAVRELGLACED